MNDLSALNKTERTVRDILGAKLTGRATITKVKQSGETIEIEVVSPNHFQWTAAALEEAAADAASASSCRLDVHLTTSWFDKA